MQNKLFDSSTIGFIFAAIILFIFIFIKNPGLAIFSTKNGFTIFLKYSLIIISSMLIATYIQALIPKEIIMKFLGKESGIKGIFIGTIIGGLTPGSPYGALTLFSGIMKIGASLPVIVSMVSAWGLWSIGRIPFQIAVMGFRFTLIQVISSLFLPIISGYIALILQKILK